MRKLLPKPHEEDERDVEALAAAPRRRKRQQVSIACDACRKRKIKCDNQRPSCTPCIQSGIDCHFVNVEDRGQRTNLTTKLEEASKNGRDLVTILDLLRSSSLHESSRLLQRIREAPSVDDFIETFSGASLLLSQAPSTYDLTAGSSRSPLASASSSHPPTLTDGEPLSVSDDLVARFPDGILPVAQWTALSNDDKYLTHLLNLFFTWDNALSYTIHRPMFMQDLKAGIPPNSSGLGFCSRFLIHSILAVAHLFLSQGSPPHRASEILSKSRSFAKVALGMLENERVNTSIPLAQGLALLWIYEVNNGRKAGATALLEDFYRVHDDLAISDTQIPSKFDGATSQRTRTGRDWQAVSYTTWGFFCLDAKISITLSRSMRLRRPRMARTFEDVHNSILANPEASGYLWSPYPQSTQNVPSLFREVVSSECRLAEFIREASRFFAFADPDTPLPDYSAVRATYEKLLELDIRDSQYTLTNKNLLPSMLFFDVTFEMVALKLLSCLCRFPSNLIDGETAASLRASYGASIISSLWVYRAAYGLRHEYWLLDACFSATMAVISKLNNNLALKKTVAMACELLQGIGDFLLVANEGLLVIKDVVDRHEIELPKPCRAIFAQLVAASGRTYVEDVELVGLGRGDVGLGVGSSQTSSDEVIFSDRIESIRDRGKE